MSVSAPILTNTIQQNFYIEALSGSKNISQFLTNFPETVYSKAVDSHLMLLMTALLGQCGAGLLETQYFNELSQTQAGNLTDTALSDLYTGSFGFRRLASESYIYDTGSQLLPLQERSQVLSADAAFRNRARLWMQALRAGGSLLGLSLAASSGLGQKVEAVPNYPALFNQFADAPLPMPYLGSTTSLDEIILLPRNNLPQNISQTISFPEGASDGQFTITVPLGPQFNYFKLSTLSAYDETLAAYNPVAWWRLNDAVGSSIALNAVNAAESGNAYNVTFGQAGPVTAANIQSVAMRGFPYPLYGFIQTAYTPTASTPLSVAAWFSSNLLPGPPGASIIDTRNGSLTDGYYLGFNSSSQLVFGLGNSATVATDTTSLAAGWHFVVGTFDGTTLTLYVDGVENATATPGTALTSPSALIIGNGPNQTNLETNWFDGNISEVAIFDTLLSASQVQILYYIINRGALSLEIPDSNAFGVGNWLSIASAPGNEGVLFLCSEILSPNRIALTATAPANLIPDPSFEYDAVGAQPIGYNVGTNWGGSAPVTAAEHYGIGSHSILCTRTNTTSGNGYISTSPSPIPVKPNTQYYFTVEAMLDSGQSGPYQLRTQPNVSAPVFSTPQNVSANSWTLFELTFTTGPEDTEIALFFDDDPNTAPASGNSVYLDAFFLSEVGPPTGLAWSYFDGDYPNYSWSGTLGDSISISTPLLGSVSVQAGCAESLPIDWNATANDIQTILGNVPVIGGPENLLCTGGPLPYNPVTITFINALSNTDIGPFLITTHSNPLVSMTDLTAPVVPTVTITQGTTGIDTTPIELNAQDLSLISEALAPIQSQTSIISINKGQSPYTRQAANSYYADQTYTQVNDYVTGAANVSWPLPDNNTNWVESGIEHEAPQLAGTFGSQYTNFHNISNAIAYTEAALIDPNYNTPLNAPIQPFYISYYDTHSGVYNNVQQLLYPILANYGNNGVTFEAAYALASQPNVPYISGVTDNLVALVDEVYPVSYLNLPGINYQPSSLGLFWSSSQRPSGIDYLEIDLGFVQAINLVYFEATNKPYSIEVAYESLDQPLIREFTPALITDAMPSVTRLDYTASNVNPWTAVYLPIANSLGNMIYSRYIRIGFTKTANGAPFMVGTQPLAYSIEVRNLRIGRVVNSFGVSFTSAL